MGHQTQGLVLTFTWGLRNWFTLNKMSKKPVPRLGTSVIYHSGKGPCPGPDGVRKTQHEDYSPILTYGYHYKSDICSQKICKHHRSVWLWGPIMCPPEPVSGSHWAHSWPSFPSLPCSPVLPHDMFWPMGMSRSEVHHLQAWPQESSYSHPPGTSSTENGRPRDRTGWPLGGKRCTGWDTCIWHYEPEINFHCVCQAALALSYTSYHYLKKYLHTSVLLNFSELFLPSK